VTPSQESAVEAQRELIEAYGVAYGVTGMEPQFITPDRLRELFKAEERCRGMEAILKESIQKLDRYANKQGAKRMLGARGGVQENPNKNAHYPAVQSIIDRGRAALGEGK
jgi:hypothetical protein